MVNRRSAMSFALALVAASGAATAQLTINFTFDSSVTSNANAAQIMSACNAAAAEIQNAYSDPITVNIRVVAAAGTSILGESQTALIGPYSYAQVRGFLASHATTADDAAALASLGTTSPVGTSGFYLATAQAKALGQRSATNPSSDGTFTFGAGIAYTFDPAQRGVAGRYDFMGVATHEITEIMGRLPGLSSSGYLIHDLYRYRGAGTRALTTGTGIYFSIDGGVTNLHGYNGNSGGDPDDWDSSAFDSFNAFATTGREEDMSQTDFRLMDVIGYTRIQAAVCYANCDSSTTTPILNVNDFICFQGKFAAGDTYANCDGSTTVPVLNVNDFICFQTRFAQGCP